MENEIGQKSPNMCDTAPAHNEGIDKTLKVMLAEDKAEIRRNLRLLFESEPDFDVICEVNNGFDALDKAGVLFPDILILGLNASNIIEIIRRLNERCPHTAIVIPHRNDNEKYEKEILGTGLKVYVFKKISPSKFIEAIRELFINKNRSNMSISRPRPVNLGWQGEKVTVDPYEILTKREREVLNLVITGFTNTMIAARLSISSRTVEIHRANMLRKLGLLNQHQQLTKYAMERRILPDINQDGWNPNEH